MMMRRIMCLLLALSLPPACALAAKEPAPTVAPATQPTLPARTEAGFLSDPAGEFVHADEEDGLWIYLSATLHIEIRRYYDPNTPLTWFETHVRASEGNPFRAIMANPEKPGRNREYPEDFTRKRGLVLAITDDFMGARLLNKKTPGVLVRDGVVIADQTHKKNSVSMPCLDVMAWYPDGSVTVHDNNELTAQQYLDLGATDTFAFGPVLVRDGELGEKIDKNMFRYKEPRCAFGMIEPGHYIILTVEGRKRMSEGCNIRWLAERMQLLGARQALNLDGGNTVSLVFMGVRLNSNINGKGSARSISSMLGAGISPLVPDAE